MKFKDVWKVALLVGVLSASSSSANADWMYSVSVLPSPIKSGNSSVYLIPNQDYHLTLNSSASIVFAISLAPVDYPPVSATFNSPLTATVTITDGVNQATATFTGFLRGTSDVSPYVLPAIFTSPTQQSGVLDGHPYTIRINAYNPIPETISSSQQDPDFVPGFISGTIDVSASTNQAPEPSSFVLACLAGLDLVFQRLVSTVS